MVRSPSCAPSSPTVRSSTAPGRRPPARTSWWRTAGSSTSAPDWTATRWSTAPARPCCPGFVDCHVHLLFSGVHPLKTLQTPFSYPYFEAVRNLRTTLDLGITTVRDAGGSDLGVKEAVATGLIPGPRVLIAVSMLSQTGGHGDGWYPSGCTVPLLQPHPGRPNTVVDGPEEIRQDRPGAGPGRRRRDQGRHQRRRAVGPGRPAARPLPATTRWR